MTVCFETGVALTERARIHRTAGTVGQGRKRQPRLALAHAGGSACGRDDNSKIFRFIPRPSEIRQNRFVGSDRADSSRRST
ncbi:MAG TPA: hypothetical protein VIV60_18325, partial [Polyangiaceae bacterium]